MPEFLKQPTAHAKRDEPDGYALGAGDAVQGRGCAPPPAPFAAEAYVMGYFSVRLGWDGSPTA